MRCRFLLAGLLSGAVLAPAAWAQSGPAAAQAGPMAKRAYNRVVFEQHAAQLYMRLGLGPAGLPLAVFREGLTGYYNLRAAGGPSVLTLIDFARPSHEKRLWVIDVAAARVRFHTLVAHGKASGADVPVAFSNREGSEMSSLGFYRTAPTTYQGKHGLSLQIRGLDPGFNTNAQNRAVVVHGAEYVCPDFVRTHGRLGRSQGCPALPVAETAAIVRAIRGGSVLFLHGPAAAGYRSRWLDVDAAAAALAGPAAAVGPAGGGRFGTSSAAAR